MRAYSCGTRPGTTPIAAFLALSDRIVASGDSVSMASEAIATGHPVAIFEMGGGQRHRRFIANLFERKLASPAGEPFLPPSDGPGPNATPEAVAALRRLIEDEIGRLV
ncbi:MAG: ELM1/GtrOC1 family putative glycosyltransferase [Caulobacteraceae bacterium]